MANSFWGGFLENLAPAIQQGQESGLKRKMMEMQMQEFQAQQQAAQREEQGQQSAISAYRAAGEDPEARKRALVEAALSRGDFATVEKLGRSAGMSLDQTLATISKFQQGQGGQPGDPYSQRMDMGFSINPEGQATVKMDPYHPAGKLGEIGALLNSIGADPNDKNMQIKAFSVINAPPEAQSMLLSQLQQEAGGRGGQPQQRPPADPQVGMEIDMGNGQKMMVDNQETLAELQRSGMMPQGQAVPQGQQQYAGGGGGSPYDVIRQKEAAAAIQRAGGEAAAREQNTVVSPGESEAIDTLKTMDDLLGTLKDFPTSATGPVQGSGIARYVGTRAPEGMGGNTEKQSDFYGHLEELESIKALARGGKTFTPGEEKRILANFPTTDLSDVEVRRRINLLSEITRTALERRTRLMTEPRGNLRQSLDVQATKPTRRVGAGGAGGLTPRAQDFLNSMMGSQ